ncbi:MAG: MarR family winged helix-turn-helix transcriptional regulator [Actinomycetota bacterium]|nr:MarR family winged helix-turn-helix transcriptional regulator [Actinomycetota bacterium]
MVRTESGARFQADSSALEEQMVALIRAFGLHRTDITPCGQTMSVSEAHALMEISNAESLSQRELGERLLLEKSTVSRLVGQLDERKWLRRSRDERDRRIVNLMLTARGRKVSERLGQARRRRFEMLLDAIPDSRRAAVIDALATVAEASNRVH